MAHSGGSLNIPCGQGPGQSRLFAKAKRSKVLRNCQKFQASSAPASPSSPARVSPESQPFLMLHTDPVLIVPYSLLQNASVFTGASTLPSQDTACVVLQDGTVQPMSQLVQGADEASAVLRLRGERNARRDAASPLDLSIRRDSNPDLIDEDEKEV